MTIDIRGKQYVTVSERVQAALDGEERYTMVSAETFSLNEHHFYRVTIRIGERQYIGTAEIKFNAKPGTPDATNPVECAETSALGRALGFAGFGVVDGIASADEMVRSEPQQRQPRQQPQPPQRREAAPGQDADNGAGAGNGNEPATPNQLTAIAQLCGQLGQAVPDVKGYGHAHALITQYNGELQRRRKAG